MTLPPGHQKCICTGRFQPGKARITAKNARTSPNCVNCNLIITLDDDEAEVLVGRLLIALKLIFQYNHRQNQTQTMFVISKENTRLIKYKYWCPV